MEPQLPHTHVQTVPETYLILLDLHLLSPPLLVSYHLQKFLDLIDLLRHFVIKLCRKVSTGNDMQSVSNQLLFFTSLLREELRLDWVKHDEAMERAKSSSSFMRTLAHVLPNLSRGAARPYTV